MRSLAVKLIVFLVIIFALLKMLDKYYTHYTLSHKNLCEKSDWILNHSKSKFDFAFIGNSRVINMVDINALEKQTGKTGINLGIIGANYAENYLVLDQFLKAGNMIKNLVIQVDMHSLNSTKELTYPFHSYNYIYLLNDSAVYTVFKDNNPHYKTLIWKYLPFARYMEFSNRYVFYKILKGGYECKTSDAFDATKGTELINGPFDPKKHVRLYSYWTIHPNDEKYLDKLVALAKKNNMQVVLYSAPVYNDYLRYQLNYKNILKEVAVKAAKEKIRFFDFGKDPNPLGRDITNFNDNIHLNADGVVKLSKLIGDSIGPLLN